MVRKRESFASYGDSVTGCIRISGAGGFLELSSWCHTDQESQQSNFCIAKEKQAEREGNIIQSRERKEKKEEVNKEERDQ